MKVDSARNVTYAEFVASGGVLAGLLPDNSVQATGANELVRISAPPKVWRGLLTQSSTSAPTAVVLENSLGGTITWARTSAGLYTGTLTGAFTASKTFLSLVQGGGVDGHYQVVRTSADVITITTDDADTPAVTDSQLSSSPLEILVYQ